MQENFDNSTFRHRPSETGHSPERRQYPRIGTQLEADLMTTNQQVLSATILNISRIGLLISCDQRSTYTITPGGYIPSGPSVEIQVSFTLPEMGKTVNAHCRLINSRRASQDEFKLGFQFMDLHGEDFKLLNEYVISAGA